MIFLFRQEKRFLGPGVADDTPAVSGPFIIVNNQDSGRSQFGGFLEFINPPAVVIHIFSVKNAAGIIPGFIDFHQQHLAPDIKTLKVIPVTLRGLNQVTAIDQFSRNFLGTIFPFALDDKIFQQNRSRDVNRPAARTRDELQAGFEVRLDPNQGEFLAIILSEERL